MEVKAMELRKDKVTVTTLQKKKERGEQITMLTAYDYPLARLIDRAGIDIIFVSDALGMVGLGYKNTLSVTMEEMLHHTRAVCRGVTSSFVIACMPFMDYNTDLEAQANARRLVKEGGADAVEMEGGPEVVKIAEAVVEAGIPVMVHIGLTRKFYSKQGKFQVQGRDALSAYELVELALKLEDIGCFAVSLECVPDRVAHVITEALRIPTIGIGSGKFCDGQGLVTQDLLGLFEDFVPKFAKQYAQVGQEISQALALFKADVDGLKFPSTEHSFAIKDDEMEHLQRLMRNRAKVADLEKEGLRWNSRRR